MAARQQDLFIFAFIPEPDSPRFVPAGRLTLSENLGAHPNDCQLASAFAY
ncbi:hypothetical protein [Azohydromonas aeria]|nr:hypothetical protein [Azohydromonas aeria]